MLKIIAIAALFCVAIVNAMKSEKIIGGMPVPIYQHPYQVSLRSYNFHICGGAIISVNFIVTAAHCTEVTPVGAMSIRAGSSSPKSGGHIRNIAEIHQHQKFDADTMDYDISILKLSESLKFGETVQAIGMPSLNEITPVGTMGVATGYGVLKEGNRKGADQLQKVLIPVISNEDCQRKYAEFKITERMLCTGYEDGIKDACQGNF